MYDDPTVSSGITADEAIELVQGKQTLAVSKKLSLGPLTKIHAFWLAGAVACPRSNLWPKLSNMCFLKNIFIPPDQHQMTHRFSHFP